MKAAGNIGFDLGNKSLNYLANFFNNSAQNLEEEPKISINENSKTMEIGKNLANFTVNAANLTVNAAKLAGQAMVLGIFLLKI